MADLAQVLATSGTALVSAAAGAGLTYWLGASNRRHQEAREDRTRWYEERLQAYVQFHEAAHEARFTLTRRDPLPSKDTRYELGRRLSSILGTIEFVGSPEVIEAAAEVFDAVVDELRKDKPYEDSEVSLIAFKVACRKDLGHPSP